MKHFYKLIALIFIFGLSIFLFRNDIPEATIGEATQTSFDSATFPIMYAKLDDYTVNTMHGYSSELDSGKIRESITPLTSEKFFTVQIQENESKIKRLDFELRDILNNKILESDTLTAFDSTDKYKTAKIKFTEALDTSTEYGLKITLTTSLSKNIHYYTRIKYYENDFFLKEKLDFVNNFHNATFKKNKDFDITNYLEANTSDNSTYADVNINSNYKLITWGKLKPKIISQVIPTINEINIETCSVSQQYYVTAETASGRETYLVKEFYRVRYSGSRIYLLNFKRTMEARFNPELISTKKSELKIGISNATDLNIVTSEDKKSFAFVRNGSLWYYSLEKNQLTQVFTFEKNNDDYLRDSLDEHDIKIIRFDENCISFMVYGYMNCGYYEGRVGILLYDYSPETKQLTERVYIPLATTYQKLKLDLGNFCYVNKKNIFYFSLNDTVYAYNISSKKYTILTENATKDEFVMLEKAKCFVWSDASKSNHPGNLTILNLDTSESLVVSAKKKENIVVLGTIDSNIVYGFVRQKDIYESTSGEIINPAYKLIISDCNGNILREYKNKNIYITSAVVDNNVIRLTRVKKVNGEFRETNSDNIMNKKSTSTPSIGITTRVTDKALTENYISLPAGYIMEKKPVVDSIENIMITENTTLNLDISETDSTKYYIYAYGQITARLSDPASAILLADEQMGVVMDNKSHIIWERGGKFLSKELSGVSYPSGSPSSIISCTHMLLQSAGQTVSIGELNGQSIISMLSEYIDQPVNLTGCTVDEILYFVSNGKPVIGMLSDTQAVLITAYTSSSVTWLNPSTYTKTTVSIDQAESMFGQAGYTFVSFI